MRKLEAEAVEAEALGRKKLEAKENSEATNFLRSWKRKQNISYCFHNPCFKLSRFSWWGRKNILCSGPQGALSTPLVKLVYFST